MVVVFKCSISFAWGLPGQGLHVPSPPCTFRGAAGWGTCVGFCPLYGLQSSRGLSSRLAQASGYRVSGLGGEEDQRARRRKHRRCWITRKMHKKKSSLWPLSSERRNRDVRNIFCPQNLSFWTPLGENGGFEDYSIRFFSKLPRM